jgi:hypothetical protein
MYHLQNLKFVNLLHASYTNGATATANIDTLGFDEVLVSIKTTTSDDGTDNWSVCKLAESDDTNASNFANVSGTVGDTDWTVPTANTSDVQIFQFHVRTAARKRYLRLSISPTTTQIITATAFLGRAAELPNTTTEQGTVSSVNV